MWAKLKLQWTGFAEIIFFCSFSFLFVFFVPLFILLVVYFKCLLSIYLALITLQPLLKTVSQPLGGLYFWRLFIVCTVVNRPVLLYGFCFINILKLLSHYQITEACSEYSFPLTLNFLLEAERLSTSDYSQSWL